MRKLPQRRPFASSAIDLSTNVTQVSTSHVLSSDWTADLLTVKDFEDLVPYISIVVLLTVCVMWYKVHHAAAAASAQDEGAKKEKEPAALRGSRKSLLWLGTLTAASLGLLIFQVVLGCLSGSLTLLADVGHAAGDTVIYFAAFISEKAKSDLTNLAASPQTVMAIDVISGCTSTLLVAGVSLKAMWDAVERLQSNNPEQQGENIHLIGHAILAFALVTFVVNMGLLLVRFQQDIDGEQEQEPESTPLPNDALQLLPAVTAMSCQPCPMQPRSPQKASAMKCLHMAFHPGCDGAHCSDKASGTASAPAALPPVATAEGAVAGQFSLAARAGVLETRLMPPPPGVWKWLHEAFHPGCDGKDCSSEDCSTRAEVASPLAREDGSSMGEGPMLREERSAVVRNLNVLGATLHLTTDVLRSIIVAVTGLLLELGLLTDVARTDAVCALVVGTCVLLGCVVFFLPVMMHCSRGRKAIAA